LRQGKMSATEEKLCFLVCWEDKTAGLVRNFHLNFYPSDNSIEMLDLKSKKLFLKKTVNEQIGPNDFYVGNSLVVFGRKLTIVDSVTKPAAGRTAESTLALVKPGSQHQLGDILTEIQQAGLKLARARLVLFSELQAGKFYDELRGQPYYQALVDYLSSGPSLALELVGPAAVRDWRELLGPLDSEAARRDCPTSLRARLGQDDINNVAHGSASVAAAKREIEMLFPESRLLSRSALLTPPSHRAPLNATTCCIIKPHAMQQAGPILQAIQAAGFTVTGLQTFLLDRHTAEEFLEVYKGVAENYGAMVTQLSSGPCLALELAGEQGETAESVVGRYREVCGPADSVVARLLRPSTLRARFGVDQDLNAVHCTDLPEDGKLEVEYFFKILQCQ